MTEFKIKTPVDGINANTKGGVLDGDVFTTNDAPWKKHLRQLPDDQVEEVVEEVVEDE